ncbi:MAG: bacteriohemerythrin [Treponema sp.]|nr:bacteriohemerythrin [Treponema sp.]
MRQPFVAWDDKYAIGVQSIDDQHKGLFELLNELHEASERGEGTAVTDCFKDALQKAVNYAATHFSAEEEIMQETGDPNYDEHQKEHNAFVRKVMEGAAAIGQERGESLGTFMDFLQDWILKHVTGVDIKIGRHIAGLKEKGLLADTTF